MTAGEAIGQARAMRPGCEIDEETMKGWLRGQDGEVRTRLMQPAGAEGFDSVGADLLWADGLADSAELLIPFPFDRVYPHYLSGMTDAALGENDRYSGEMDRCNAVLGEFAVWLRRNFKPVPRQVRW